MNSIDMGLVRRLRNFISSDPKPFDLVLEEKLHQHLDFIRGWNADKCLQYPDNKFYKAELNKSGSLEELEEAYNMEFDESLWPSPRYTVDKRKRFMKLCRETGIIEAANVKELSFDTFLYALSTEATRYWTIRYKKDVLLDKYVLLRRLGVQPERRDKAINFLPSEKDGIQCNRYSIRPLDNVHYASEFWQSLEHKKQHRRYY